MAGHELGFATQTQLNRELNGGDFDDGHGFVHGMTGRVGWMIVGLWGGAGAGGDVSGMD